MFLRHPLCHALLLTFCFVGYQVSITCAEDSKDPQLLVLEYETKITDDDGEFVATQYRGDTLHSDKEENDLYHVVSPAGWIPKADVVNLEEGIKKSGVRIRGKKTKEGGSPADLALMEMAKGNLDEAEKMIDQALEDSPDDEKGLVTRALILLEQDQTDLALEDLKQAYDLNPVNVQTILLMVRCYNDNIEHQEVVDLLNKVPLDRTANADLQIAEGFSLWMLNRNEEALECAQRALDLGSTRFDVYYQIGIANWSLGNPEEAVKWLTQAEELDDESINTQYYLAKAFHDLRQEDSAVEHYGKLLELSPDDHEARLERSRIYRKLDEFESATTDLDYIIENDENENRVAEAMLIRGLVQEDQGDLQGARKDMDRSVEHDPTYWPGWRERGRLRYSLNEPEGSEQDLLKAIELNPNDVLTYRFLGDVYRLLARYPESLTAYTKAIEIDPDDSVAWNNRGIAQELNGDDQKAIADYQQAIEIFPGDPTYALNLVSVYKRTQQIEEADQVLEKAINAYQGDPIRLGDLLFQRGELCRTTNQFEKAIPFYREALKNNDEHAGAYNCRGICYDAIGDYKQAIRDYTQAFRYDPDSSVVLVNRGDSYRKLGEYENAHQDYTQAMEMNPDDALAYNQRGLLYYNLNDYPTAISDFEAALERNEDYRSARANLADALRYSDRLDEAVENYSRILAIEPLNVTMLYGRAECYRRLGRMNEAEAGYRTVLSQEDTYDLAWVGLGELYEARNRMSEAIQFYGKAAEINPEYLYAFYRRARAYRSEAQNDKAAADFGRVLELDPDHISARVFRANCLRDLGKYEDALADYNNALHRSPGNSYILSDRAVCFELLTRYQEAAQDYDAAIEADGGNTTAWNDSAKLHATIRVKGIFQPELALERATRACELTERKNPYFLHTLAAAQAAAEEYQEAVKTEQEAIQVAQSSGSRDRAFLNLARDRVKLYQSGKPFIQGNNNVPAPVKPSGTTPRPSTPKKSGGGLGSGAGSLFGNPTPPSPPKEEPAPDQAL